MTNEYEYHIRRRPDRTYISKQWGDLFRRLRTVYKVFDTEQHSIESERDIDTDVDSLVLSEHIENEGRVEVRAVFYTDTREIERVHFLKFDDGYPRHKWQITLSADALRKFSILLKAIRALPLEEEGGSRFDDDLLYGIFEAMSEDGVRKVLEQHPDVVRSVAEYDLTNRDIVGLGYRKIQLDVFERLIFDANYFSEMQREWNKAKREDVWQHFFEANPWIFGYGLQYVFTSKFDDAKRDSLRQMVVGNRIGQAGKEADAFMRTNGALSSVCFVEIKRHDAKLMKPVKNPYRAECWQVSDELTGAIAQTQQTVRIAMNAIGEELRLKDIEGFPVDSAFLYQPKGFVVIGSLSEFVKDGEVNEEQWPSFQLFRRSVTNPEIITFDELLERARHIVQHYDGNQKDDLNGSLEETSLPDDEVPF